MDNKDVFCCECEYNDTFYFEEIGGCRHSNATTIVKTYYEIKWKYDLMSERNKNNDCKDFESWRKKYKKPVKPQKSLLRILKNIVG